MFLLSSIFYFFSPYAHPFERKVNKFLQWVTSFRSQSEIHSRLLGLMQENLLVLNMWLEKRFKNYKYLKKGSRKKMYMNSDLIEMDFDKFRRAYTADESYVKNLASQSEEFFNAKDRQKLAYLCAIAAYFKTRFHYNQASAFWKLLVNPQKEKMVGDCNQIVTLYAHLFSKAFPITDLKVKLLPDHICLHFKGIDIEATQGQFVLYKKYDYLEPITELIVTNLMDIHDPTESFASIEPDSFVKAAQLAYAVSSRRELVERNLSVAYRNLCVTALRHRNLQKAYFYAEKSGQQDLMKACWAEEFNMLAAKTHGLKTVKQARGQRHVYEKMLSLSRKIGDIKLESEMNKILKQIL